MEQQCRDEVERLHRFFVDWFCGNVPNDKEYFTSHCANAFAPNMTMIAPSGVLLSCSALVSQLQEAYGCYTGKTFAIDIQNVRVIQAYNDHHCLMSYQECQVVNDKRTARVSTALFQRTSREASGTTIGHESSGVQWVHLQETWMDATTCNSVEPPPTQQDSFAAPSIQAPYQPAPLARPTLTREASRVSKRRHLYPEISNEFQEIQMVNNTDGDIEGITIEGWKITTQQGSIADEAWMTQATERLSELSQPTTHKPTVEADEDHVDVRRLNLPEMVFSHAHVTLLHEEHQLKVTFGAYGALRAWALAHKEIPLQSSKVCQGVSVLQSIDAALWQHRKGMRTSNSSGDLLSSSFHYDWTFSTPHASSCTMDISWQPLDASGIKLSLLQDQSVPILLFDDVLLYEDDLHDNGEVTLSVKIRVMPTCAFCLERLWLRVDRVLLRVRETRVMLEFGGEGKEAAVYRDVSWRECPWEQLEQHGLPTDLRSWCAPPEGSTESRDFQEQLQKLPSVPLPADLPAFSVLKE